METNDLTHSIIAAAMKIHSKLGPGMFEGIYQDCLAYELRKSGFELKRQQKVPLVYEELRIKSAYRYDLLVENRIIVEIKSIETVLPVHKAQTLSYIRLLNLQVGLLINFNVVSLRHGITRVANNFKEPLCPPSRETTR